MTTVENSTELQQWIDRQAIMDLIYRYSDAVTRGDGEQLDSVFYDDSVLEIGPPFNLRHEGLADIRQLVIEGSTTLEFLVQTASCPVIKLLGPDRAQATTTIYEFLRGSSTADSDMAEAGTAMNMGQYGVYFDDIVKIDGEWKFAHRLMRSIYLETGELTGNAMTPRSELAG
jgi:hypothetical protein